MKQLIEKHKILLFSISSILYLLLTFYLGEIFEKYAKVTSGILMVIVIAITILSCKKNKEKSKFEKMVFCIMAIGVILRAMYISYTPVTDRQHDVYDINSQGHLGYIYTIYETRKIARYK